MCCTRPPHVSVATIFEISLPENIINKRFSWVPVKVSVFEKYTHLQINLVFMRDSTESLVYDILQLTVLHTGRLMIQLARYSRYRSLSRNHIGAYCY
ncbi:hypothetical protein T265_05085 [Opisthorchis viverrini]|uniref:Uncharacterized protein n=1 Tax=Opisthorchis viverrini TaxID=6198 RepID=A0A074ZX77_OPIVI|nr:hypothetical protein T265_05085 [Opisthorchis viverrini]KER27960.1 hypothetical protein T265_05085 [Opisthorchis viverrini]